MARATRGLDAQVHKPTPALAANSNSASDASVAARTWSLSGGHALVIPKVRRRIGIVHPAATRGPDEIRRHRVTGPPERQARRA